MDITDTTMGAGAVWVVDKRLRYHAQEGGLLSGLKISDEDKALGVDGQDDLPHLRFLTLSSEGESIVAGAPSADTRVMGSNNTPIKDTLILSFLLSTKADKGYIQRGASDDPGLINWVSRIKDAIEIPARPRKVLITGCSDNTYNTDYVYDNDRDSPSYGRWVHINDATKYIYWDRTVPSWLTYGGGDIQGELSGGFDTGPMGQYEADGDIDDEDGWLVKIPDISSFYPLEDLLSAPDAMLEHTLYEPVSFRMKEWENNQGAFTIMLDVVLSTRPTCRAQRSYTIPNSLTPYP